MKRLLAFCLLASAVDIASGATYYVATNGSDSADGSSGAPWMTWQKAVTTVSANDTILVQPGVYDEYVQVASSKNGTGTNRFYLRANGAVTNRGKILMQGSGWTLDGFEFDSQSTSNNAYLRGAVWLYGPISNIWIINNYFHDSPTNIYPCTGVYCDGANVAPTNYTVSLIVSNNIFRGWRSGACIALNGTGGEIVGNVMADSWSHDGVDVFGTNHWIHNNLFTNISSVAGMGDHPDIVQTWGYSGIYGRHVLFERNYCINCLCQVCQLEQDGTTNVTDWTFQNNVFVSVYLQGSIDITACRFLNNTFYNCFTNGPGLGFAFYNPTNAEYKGQAYGGCVSNNAFIACGNSASSGWYAQAAEDGYTPSPPMDILTNSDYNYVCTSTNGWTPKTAGSSWGGDAFKFYEPHGVNGGDPKLPHLDILGLKPTAGSVLVDAGAALAGVTNDYDGTVRPQGSAPDIGAYELDTSLKLWFPFTEDFVTRSNVSDWTGNSHTGLPCGDAATNWVKATSGIFGGQAGLWVTNMTILEPPSTVIPVSQYIGVTNLTGIDTLTNGTISWWLQWGVIKKTDSFILDSGYPPQYSGLSNSWTIWGDGTSALKFEVYDSSAYYGRDVIAWPTMETNRFHLYTLAWSCPSNRIETFYDGALYQSNTITGAGTNAIPAFKLFGCTTTPWLAVGRMAHDMIPGAYTNNGAYAAGFLDGKLDDIRFYDRELSAQEVFTLATETPMSVPLGVEGGSTNPPPVVVTNITLNVSGKATIGTLRSAQ